MIDIERALAIGNVALKAIDMIEMAARTFTNAMATGKMQLSSALDELKQMHETLKTDRDKTDSDIDKKFK